jgi:hypothetical protein
MKPQIYLVVNVDADPDPVDSPADNDAVLEKYQIIQQLINERCDGMAVISVHSSPLYRERFIQPPFVDFWKEWTSGGGDLVLHLEEDFYALPENRRASSTGFENLEIVEQAMKETLSALASEGLACQAYRGGSNSMTPEIAEVLTELGISVDLSCAPGLVWKERVVNWASAPLSGYFMSAQAPARAADPGEQGPLLEIPLGWDGINDGDDVPRKPNHHYLANESSTFEDLCRVWDIILKRADDTGNHQAVSLLSHTHTAKTARFHSQLDAFLRFATTNRGIPASLTEIRTLVSGATESA